MSDDVLYEKRADGIGLITLNRPESLNAMGGELVPMLGQFLSECEADHEVRCVVLTGNGRGFCAGGDVRGMQSRNSAALATPGAERPERNIVTQIEHAARGLREMHDATALQLHEMLKPTVGLINGVAVGAGLSLALACDVRIVSDQARFGTAFKNVGLSGDFGGTYLLPRIVGMGRARELYLTAEIINAERAFEWGIANRVVPHAALMEEGLAFAATIANGPTATYARMKANWNVAETSNFQTLLDAEALQQQIGRAHV